MVLFGVVPQPLAFGRFSMNPAGPLRKSLLVCLAEPKIWLADVFAKIADNPVHRLNDLLPWQWAANRERRKLAA